MSEQFLRRPETILNDFKYPMPTAIKPRDGQKYPSTWVWDIAAKGNKVFFKINDGVYGKDDPNKKLKEVELKAHHRNALLNVIDEAITNPNFGSSQYDVKDKLYNRQTGRFNDTLSVLATFTVIRGKRGEIRVHYKRSTYEETFALSTEYIAIRTRNEEGVFVPDPGLSSRAYARYFVDFSRKFLDIEEWNRYSRKPKDDSGDSGDNQYSGGGNRGNSNGGGGGNNDYTGNNQSASSGDIDFDEDF